jgi:VWFA-related protein
VPIPLLFILCAAIGQNTATTQNVDLKAKTDAPAASTGRQISLDVQVTDNKGEPIRGLQQQDFTVLDGKETQKIVSFHALGGETASSAEPPVEVILVIDAVNPTPTAPGMVRDGVKKFLLRNDGQLAQPMSLAIFGRNGTAMRQDSSRDGKALVALYDQYSTGLLTLNNQAQGLYGDGERFDLSLEYLDSLLDTLSTRPGRKLVLWFSPGWPMLTGTSIEFSNKAHQGFFDSVVAFSTRLRQVRMTLYAIDPSGVDEPEMQAGFYTDYLKPMTSPSKTQPAHLGLQVFAIQSGGRVLMENDVAKAIAECARDADSYYVLSIEAPQGGRANDYHKLAVTVNRPKTIARMRNGYYAQP